MITYLGVLIAPRRTVCTKRRNWGEVMCFEKNRKEGGAHFLYAALENRDQTKQAFVKGGLLMLKAYYIVCIKLVKGIQQGLTFIKKIASGVMGTFYKETLKKAGKGIHKLHFLLTGKWVKHMGTSLKI